MFGFPVLFYPLLFAIKLFFVVRYYQKIEKRQSGEFMK